MSISLTPFTENNLCQGYTWTITNEEALAEQIALIALGLAHHVKKIVAGVNPRKVSTNTDAATDAIKMLTVTGSDDPWHRDGWIFQCISWIAANHASPRGIIAPPQMVHAQKGFDGMQLEVDEITGKITAIIIFEDKATDDARKMIREKVWPEFKSFEAGNRTNEITAQVVILLQANGVPDPDESIEEIIWKNVRRYRVSITINEEENNSEGRNKLFKGYENVAKNPLSRRGETIYLENLRNWMGQIAEKSISIIRAKAATNV